MCIQRIGPINWEKLIEMENRYLLKNFQLSDSLIQNHYTPLLEQIGIEDNVGGIIPESYIRFSDHIMPYYTYNLPQIFRTFPRKRKSESVETVPESVTPESEKFEIQTPVAAPIVSQKEQTGAESQSNSVAKTYTPTYIVSGGKKVRDTATNKNNFIRTFLPIYRKVLKERGISEDFAESLVAQAALESG